MKKSISTDLTSANIANVLKVLAESPAKLEELSKSASAAKLRQPLGKGERSFAEDLAHLINGEARSSEMIYQALLVNEPYVADIHPDRDWGKLLRFDLLDVPDLIAYFKTRRKVLLRILSALTEAQWARAVREEGKKRKESVYWRARTIAMHELDHLGDLEKKLR
ncbi:MAG: DinB family protein [Anaerolineales bacterium]|nr:DinB family protein [Anaerolineales bacterium]